MRVAITKKIAVKTSFDYACLLFQNVFIMQPVHIAKLFHHIFKGAFTAQFRNLQKKFVTQITTLLPTNTSTHVPLI
jgi:hypothetical protein